MLHRYTKIFTLLKDTETSKKNDGRVTDGCTIGRQEYRAVTRGRRNACARGWIVYQRDTEENEC